MSQMLCSKQTVLTVISTLPYAVAPVAQVVPPQVAGPRPGSQQPGMGMQRGRPMAGPRRQMVGSPVHCYGVSILKEKDPP